jgi:hypothetical protein
VWCGVVDITGKNLYIIVYLSNANPMLCSAKLLQLTWHLPVFKGCQQKGKREL